MSSIGPKSTDEKLGAVNKLVATDKPEIVESAANVMTVKNTPDYPFWRVTLLFSVVGTGISALILELLRMALIIQGDFSQGEWATLITLALASCLPASITGIVLAYKRVWQQDEMTGSRSFLAGFVVSALYIILLYGYLEFSLFDNPYSFSMQMLQMALFAIFAIGIFGGICASLTSMLVLPKRESQDD